MDAVCALLLLLVLQLEVNGDKCSSNDATLYHANIKNLISAEQYVNAVPEENFSFTINATKVRALAFDYKFSNVLFVDDEKPDAIFGIGYTAGVHMVLQEDGSSFDSIVVDPATNNIYFADNYRGIGVCTNHRSGKDCTILVSKSTNKTTAYHNLILHSQLGIMYWIQKMDGQKSEVKTAGMDGQHARTLSQFDTAQSITLDASNDHLYVSLMTGVVKKYNAHKRTVEQMSGFSMGEIYFLNCKIVGYENQNANTTSVADMVFPNQVITLILNGDWAFKPHPCLKIDCDGICVLSETFPKPLPTCISIKQNQPIVLEKTVEKVRVEVQQLPLNHALLGTTVALSTILICIAFYVIGTRVCVKFRKQIPCFSNSSEDSPSPNTTKSSQV